MSIKVFKEAKVGESSRCSNSNGDSDVSQGMVSVMEEFSAISDTYEINKQPDFIDPGYIQPKSCDLDDPVMESHQDDYNPCHPEDQPRNVMIPGLNHGLADDTSTSASLRHLFSTRPVQLKPPTPIRKF